MGYCGMTLRGAGFCMVVHDGWAQERAHQIQLRGAAKLARELSHMARRAPKIPEKVCGLSREADSPNV